MFLSTDSILDLIGGILGLIFFILTIKASHSLAGSFFKTYYRQMIIGSLFFAAGFFTALLELFGVSELWANNTHHLLLIITGFIFVLTAISFPKEVGRIMQEPK